MGIIQRVLKGRCVYWKKLKNGKDGMPVYEDPIEIKCRWVDMAVQYTDTQNRVVASQSVVMADRELQLGGALKNATLASLGTTSVSDLEGVYEIKQRKHIPNFRQTETLREYFL